MSSGLPPQRTAHRSTNVLSRPATMATFGGAQRQMLPGPVGDLETARLASGAANVVAYIANPTAHNSGTDSYT